LSIQTQGYYKNADAATDQESNKNKNQLTKKKKKNAIEPEKAPRNAYKIQTLPVIQTSKHHP
jgi:hypothetical protein